MFGFIRVQKLGVWVQGFKALGSGVQINLGFRILEFGFKDYLRRFNLIKNDRAKRYHKSAIPNPKSKIVHKSYLMHDYIHPAGPRDG
jgi:hypothetical protein